MAKRDFYEILGVPKNADDSAIKKAYRKVAMQYHPDKNPGDKAAEEKFKEAAEAYEVLSNPDKKARYDRYGHAGVDGQQGFGGGGHGMTMEDIFSHFGDVFGNDGGSPFESFFGRGGDQRGGGKRGSDLRIKSTLTLEEVAHGVNKKIKVKKDIRCDQCDGSGAKDKNSVGRCQTCGGAGKVRQVRSTFLGQMQTVSTCPTCSGSGQVVTSNCSKCHGKGHMTGEETIEFDIPAGVEDGMQLSLRGKGNYGSNGGGAGDLLIRIEVQQHPHFEREGNNLVHELFLNFADAALGTQLEVPTIDGKAKIKIPAGTQSGKIFRLKGKGLPSVQAYGTGDLLVHINIWTPRKLSDDEKQIMERLRNMSNFQPSPTKEDKGFFERMRNMFSSEA